MSKRAFKILVVDDDEGLREVLDIVLSNAGYNVITAASVEEAQSPLERELIDVVVTDLYMGRDRKAGLRLLEYLNENQPDTPALMITGHGTIESAVEAMRLGALDYLQKPFKSNEEVLLRVARAVEKRILLRENRAFRLDQSRTAHVNTLVGDSPKFKKMLDMVRRVAGLPSTVAINGESGVGKELVARALHSLSPRAEKPFVAINCGGIPENLLESELFGYKKGAFTGAQQDKEGLFVVADGGTLFLDEIGEMPIALQVKLLRVLDDGSVTPVGGLSSKAVDVRVLSATNRNLAEMVEQGTFRNDLYYRLNVIPITVPPLRERISDIPLLVRYLIARHTKNLICKEKSLSPEALDALTRYAWPGNIREMSNVLERALGLSDHDDIRLEDLPAHIRDLPDSHPPKKPILLDDYIDLESEVAQFEREYIQHALEQCHYSLSKTAQRLGLTPRTLRYRLEKYNLTTE
ncbi:MAG: sigma-54-dependent Fis family transcriptional regulator [Candidatus Hydrogenedentes bacterium]|nr:sigma-54-dependent Fis family transcriptional regulator [Candidatus Hydrogenedentota bacterium]